MKPIDAMAADERTARVILSLASHPGDVVTGRLLRTSGAAATLQMAVGSTPLDRIEEKLWQQRIISQLDTVNVHRTFEDAARLHVTMLMPGDTDWPPGMEVLGDRSPVMLWAKGDTRLLPFVVTDRIALTGARAASGYGEHVAMELASEAVRDGRQIVSGGAYGIDGAAHRAALAADGATIAILAGGLDRLYPAGNQDLLTRVGDAGLLLSEAAPGVAPTKWRFQERGRLLSALSGALVVVEAGYRSGTLAAAARASELGRPVGAVPGPVTSATSAGCHRLVQDGIAKIVTGYDDITALINQAPAADRSLDRMQKLAAPSLGTAPVSRDAQDSSRSL